MNNSYNFQCDSDYWDEGVFDSSKWMYDLLVRSGQSGVVHVPLILMSRLRIMHESYAYATAEFPSLLGLENSFHTSITDGAAVRFPLMEIDDFREDCFTILANNAQTVSSLAKQSILIKKWFPKLMIKAEQQFLTGEPVSSILLSRLFRMHARLIALNLTNPFFEILFIKFNKLHQEDSSYTEKVKALVFPPIFSHITYFTAETTRLKESLTGNTIDIERVLEFCWTKGFLGSSIGDGSEYEVPHYMASLCGQSNFSSDIKLTDINTSGIRLPDINFDPSGITDSWQNKEDPITRSLKFFRLLQINEEFRHYWGLRLIRLFRVMAPDSKAMEEWGINDYAKNI